MRLRDIGRDTGPFRMPKRSERKHSPAIELTPPGGEPMCFVLPFDADALIKELAGAWESGAWRDIEMRTVVDCRGKGDDEDSGER